MPSLEFFFIVHLRVKAFQAFANWPGHNVVEIFERVNLNTEAALEIVGVATKSVISSTLNVQSDQIETERFVR